MDPKSIRQARSPMGSLKHIVNAQSLEVTWLAGDGSDRSYFRVSEKGASKSWVLMQLGDVDRKALEKQNYDWVHLQEVLRKSGVRVPQLFRALPEHGEILIEDCKDTSFEQAIRKYSNTLDSKNIEELYLKAFAVIAKMLKIRGSTHDFWCKRSFDKDKLSWELSFFVAKYLEDYLSLTLKDTEKCQLLEDIQNLSGFLASRPQFFVHRDFHSRNLMLRDDDLIVIDFQDARLGPCAYDVVSLCFDSYVPIDLSSRRKLMSEAKYFLSRTVDPILDQELTITANAMLLQRQLKALGSFAFLTLEKSRGDFLKYAEHAIVTLDGIYDKRWPFLSGTLLEKIH